MNESDLVNINQPPNTELRESLIMLSHPNPILFLIYLKDEIEFGNYSGNMKLSAENLFDMYKKWCPENGEKCKSNFAFDNDITGKIIKKQTLNEYIYDLNSISI